MARIDDFISGISLEKHGIGDIIDGRSLHGIPKTAYLDLYDELCEIEDVLVTYKSKHDYDKPDAIANALQLVFIGDKFYSESGTMMSCLYNEDGCRSDWGRVNVALRNGDSVKIRPATEDEVRSYEEQLALIKTKFI